MYRDQVTPNRSEQDAPPKHSAWRTWHKVTLGVIGGIAGLILVIVIIAGITTDTSDEPDAIPAGFDSYRAAIDAIDPAILDGRNDQPVHNDADNTCHDIGEGVDEETLIGRVQARYGMGDAEGIVTEDIAAQILEVTRDHCDMIRPGQAR